MCRNCFEHEIYSFSTIADFTKFDETLMRKLATKQLSVTGRPSPKPPAAYDAEQSYECLSCQEFWFLAAPDNAWRGYFLPAKTALAYQRNLQLRDRRIKLMGVLLLALLTTLLGWWLLSY